MGNFEPRYHPGLVKPLIEALRVHRTVNDEVRDEMQKIAEYAAHEATKTDLSLLVIECYLCVEQEIGRDIALLLSGFLTGAIDEILEE